MNESETISSSKRASVYSQTAETSVFENGLLRCINPATMETITKLNISTEKEIREKIDSLKEAQQEWSALSSKDRAKVLKKMRKHLVERMDEVMEVILKETGKTDFDGIIEILTTVEIMRFVSSAGPRTLASEKRSMGIVMKTKRGSVQYLPFGIVGIISPWNYPLILSASPVVQALMGGNGVLLKPSEYTPLTALKMKEVFDEGGLPAGLLQVVIGGGDLGEAIVASPDTDLICFIGSVKVGKLIGVACAEQMKPVILELGGKDPLIVLADANIERAARAAVWGGFHNAGQTCISVERVYVEEAVADQFIERVSQLAIETQMGSQQSTCDLGSMTTNPQAAKVLAQIADARKRGANIMVGGQELPNREGHFIQPTVVVDVDETMELMNRETFGPVIAISKVKDADEAVDRSNSLSYGLNASIFTQDLKKARELSKRIQAGNICINDVESNYLCVSLPFGGTGSSGYGRLQGVEGIKAFAQVQAVCEDRFGLKRELWWFPVSDGVKKLFRALIKILYG
jgi:succinate-semialdehyde dehydrogenase/glutarate-semialdehyde dehydrogenase